MYQRLFFVIVVVFKMNLSANALQNFNKVDVGSARRVEDASEALIPIDTHLHADNVNLDKEIENSKKLPTDGKSKILMEVGHPRHDKLNFSPGETVIKKDDNIESMSNRKRRSHVHHLGRGCLGRCGIGGGYLPNGGIGVGGIGSGGSHSGSGSYSSAQSSASSSSWSEGGGDHHHHKMNYGKK